MDKKTTHSFSSSSVKPAEVFGNALPDGHRSLRENFGFSS